jgi:hypothetical protein
MSNNLFVTSAQNDNESLSDLLNFDSLRSPAPLPSWVNDLQSTNSAQAGGFDLRSAILKDMDKKDATSSMGSSGPINTSEIKAQLNILREESAFKNEIESQAGGSRKISGSRKLKGGKRKQPKASNVSSTSPSVSTPSPFSEGTVQLLEGKVAKSAKKVKQSRSSSPSRSENPALAAYRGLVVHIQTAMGLKGGPKLQVFASVYNNMAKAKYPEMDSISRSSKAKEIFDAEPENKRNERWAQSQKDYDKKRAAKKAAKKAAQESSASL